MKFDYHERSLMLTTVSLQTRTGSGVRRVLQADSYRNCNVV